MSWILKKMNRKKILMIFLLLLCVFVKWYSFAIVLCLLCCIYLSNKLIVHRIYAQKEPFGFASTIRNVDYLYIGDIYNVKNIIPTGKTFVQISAPDRSLMSAYEILRHTHSILKENGGIVIIAIKEQNIHSNEYSIFDIPFFPLITIKRLQLMKICQRAKFALVFHPIYVIRFLLEIGSRYHEKRECPIKEIRDFCFERGIELCFVFLK